VSEVVLSAAAFNGTTGYTNNAYTLSALSIPAAAAASDHVLAENFHYIWPPRNATGLSDPGLTITDVKTLPPEPTGPNAGLQAFAVTVAAAALPVPTLWLETLLCCGRWSTNGVFLGRSPANFTYYHIPDTRPPPWGASGGDNITAGQLAASLSIFSLWDTAGYGSPPS
jgi:hypothetical protein